MKTYRLVTLSFVIFSLIFIYGFKKPVKKHRLIKQKPAVEEHQQAKQLDLAVPASSSATLLAGGEQTDIDTLQNQAASAAQIFDSTRATNKPLEMKGQIIMSQEPEVEKSKSADGAGIMINIRH